MNNEQELSPAVGLLAALGIGLPVGILANLARRAIVGKPAMRKVAGRYLYEHGSSIPDLLTILAGPVATTAGYAASVAHEHDKRNPPIRRHLLEE